MACAIAEDSELRNVVVKNLLSVSNQSFGDGGGAGTKENARKAEYMALGYRSDK
tara:strand:+ start:1113 stop:1274 length:162 start_codon:yes stop_codon:yes gene_type:complete